jgi:uncharacterized membrane protein
MGQARRIWKHLTTPRRVVARAFPDPVWQTVESAVANVERLHDVELRVVAEAGLPLANLLQGQTSRGRAIELFTLLRVWDTEHNCGVLIYVQMADRKIEIVADRGINARVAQAEWDRICGLIVAAFRGGNFEEGTIIGIREITELVRKHVPARGDPPANELPDRPLVV